VETKASLREGGAGGGKNNARGKVKRGGGMEQGIPQNGQNKKGGEKREGKIGSMERGLGQRKHSVKKNLHGPKGQDKSIKRGRNEKGPLFCSWGYVRRKVHPSAKEGIYPGVSDNESENMELALGKSCQPIPKDISQRTKMVGGWWFAEHWEKHCERGGIQSFRKEALLEENYSKTCRGKDLQCEDPKNF